MMTPKCEQSNQSWSWTWIDCHKLEAWCDIIGMVLISSQWYGLHLQIVRDDLYKCHIQKGPVWIMIQDEIKNGNDPDDRYVTCVDTTKQGTWRAQQKKPKQSLNQLWTAIKIESAPKRYNRPRRSNTSRRYLHDARRDPLARKSY